MPCHASSLVLLGITLLLTFVKGQGVFTDCLNPGHLAITFDDGPHSSVTPRLLDLFRSYNLSTTFFVLGPGNWETNPTAYREAIRNAYNAGHQIGSHSWSHPDLTVNMTAEEVRSQLRQTAEIVRDILGRNMTVFRPPYGSYNDLVLQIAEEEFGYAVVNWNVDTLDWSHPEDPQAGFQEYLSAVNSGNYSSYIGLHHDWTGGAVELANMTIQYTFQQNLTLVTVAECVGVPMYR